MIRNSKGWPIADGGVGKLSRTDSITFYESVFTTAHIAALVEPRKIPRSSAPSSSSEENMLKILRSSMKQLAISETAKQRHVAAHHLDEVMRQSEKLLVFAETVALNAESKLRINTSDCTDDLFRDLLLSLAVKNAKDWPSAVGGLTGVKARLSDIESYETIFAPISSDIKAGRGSIKGMVEYGSVVLRGSHVIGINEHAHLSENEDEAFSSEKGETKEEVLAKWQKVRDVAKTHWHRVHADADEKLRLRRIEKVASEARFQRACEKREKSRVQRPRTWICPIAFEEDMPELVMWVVADPSYHFYCEAVARLLTDV